jgi:hypothetical protein
MDEKANTVIYDFQKGRKPSEEYTEAMTQYYTYVSQGTCSDAEVYTAFHIYGDKLQKEIIEALLFGDADFGDIEEAFGVSAKTLNVYEELFFDRTKFKNKLDKLSYVESYKDKLGRELKLRALNLGPEFVLYTYANIVPKTSQQRTLVQRMFMASAYKAMSINYNTLDSKVTKNAVDHAKLMLKAWEALQKFSEEDVSDDMDLIKIATKEVKDASPNINDTLINKSDII